MQDKALRSLHSRCKTQFQNQRLWFSGQIHSVLKGFHCVAISTLFKTIFLVWLEAALKRREGIPQICCDLNDTTFLWNGFLYQSISMSFCFCFWYLVWRNRTRSRVKMLKSSMWMRPGERSYLNSWELCRYVNINSLRDFEGHGVNHRYGTERGIKGLLKWTWICWELPLAALNISKYTIHFALFDSDASNIHESSIWHG
jgi:hypothetical protein